MGDKTGVGLSIYPQSRTVWWEAVCLPAALGIWEYSSIIPVIVTNILNKNNLGVIPLKISG